MNQKQLETWAPWGLLVATLVLWQAACSLFNVSEFVFPSPLRIWEQMVEYRDVIAGHAWRTFWVTMVGFGIAIVVVPNPTMVTQKVRQAWPAMTSRYSTICSQMRRGEGNTNSDTLKSEHVACQMTKVVTSKPQGAQVSSCF